MNHPNWRWLESTRWLQEEVFKKDFSKPLDPDEFADEIVLNYAALTVELGEFMQEIGWKNWATPRGWHNRDAAIGELVDAAHFLANVLIHLDVTDDEWERRYREKQAINQQRQANGYTGRNKCPGCHRAYDDVGVECADQRVVAPADDLWNDGPAKTTVIDAWCAVKRKSF